MDSPNNGLSRVETKGKGHETANFLDFILTGKLV